MTSRFRSIFLIFATFVLVTSSFAATSTTTSKNKKKEGRVAESARAQRHMARLRHKRAVAHRTRKAGAKSAVVGKRSGGASLRNASTATSRSARLRHRRHR